MFADLIEEAGEHARARFIRTQVALARLPPYDAACVAARQHEPDAATGHCMVHTLPKVPDGASWRSFEFRRGFPWKVGVHSLGELVRSGDALFAAAPIRALAIDARDRPDLAALAEWPQLARLHKLELSVGWFGADGIARLAGSAHATGLTELGFEADGLAPDGLRTLAASPLFPRLTALDLRSLQMPAALLVDALGAARAAARCHVCRSRSTASAATTPSTCSACPSCASSSTSMSATTGSAWTG